MRKPVTTSQKTGYTVTDDSGEAYTEAGHSYFSKDIARARARELGGMYHDGPRGTVKNVVTGYQDGDE